MYNRRIPLRLRHNDSHNPTPDIQQLDDDRRLIRMCRHTMPLLRRLAYKRYGSMTYPSKLECDRDMQHARECRHLDTDATTRHSYPATYDPDPPTTQRLVCETDVIQPACVRKLSMPASLKCSGITTMVSTTSVSILTNHHAPQIVICYDV